MIIILAQMHPGLSLTKASVSKGNRSEDNGEVVSLCEREY